MLARALLAVLLILAGPALGRAQQRGSVVQGGTITPHHVAEWSTNGVIDDPGPATNSGLTSLGVTGVGSTLCSSSARTPSPLVQFCINMDPVGGVSFIDQSIGGAAHVPMKFVVNGNTGLTITDGGFTLGGTLNVAGGGTGLSALQAGGILVGNGTGPVNILAPGLSGSCISSNGSAWVASSSCGSGGGGTVTSVGTGTGLTGGNITTSGTVSLAPTNNGTILANISGSTAAPLPNTLSAIIDGTIGVTRGGILERGLSGWNLLVPSSTPGQALLSNGVGADPSYQSIVNSLASNSGITVSAGTGNITVSLGPIANNTLMANTSGSSSPAISTSPSALWDSAFSNAVGGIFYRGSGGWASLPPGTSGQVLQTLGSNNVPQWVTISGTGTVTSVTCGSGLSGGTITGAGTCSITAPVVVSLGGTGATSLTAHGVVLGEGTSPVAVVASSGSSQVLFGTGNTADPSFVSTSSALDTSFGATQGQILYRNASNWTVLNPGTSGQFLQSGGAAANPSWASAAGGGTVTSVTCGNGLSGGTFTSSGTCAISAPVSAANGGTGNTTLTAHGVVVGEGASAAAITAAGAANSVLTGTGATTDPAFTALSTVIDNAFSASAQGTVLYRGASGWTALAPGTSGQVLKTNGSGANPSWATGGGSGSVTSITAGTGLTGGTITTSGTIALSTPVVAANGGTGQSTLTAHGVMVGEGTGNVVALTPGTSGQVLTSAGTGSDPTWVTPAAAVHGSQVGVQVFATAGSSTYTPDAGTFSVIVECQGAGGAGGGAAATGSGQNSVAAGGAGGSYSRSNISGGFSGVTVVVGQGGTGVSGAAGNGGGASSFGSILTCPGGGGGQTSAAAASVGITAYSSPGSAATGGNLVNGAGNPGIPGICVSATQCQAGAGGGSAMGGGGKPGASGGPGSAATVPGAGGGGAQNLASLGAQTGGAGGNGLIIVYEFN